MRPIYNTLNQKSPRLLKKRKFYGNGAIVIGFRTKK